MLDKFGFPEYLPESHYHIDIGTGKQWKILIFWGTMDPNKNNNVHTMIFMSSWMELKKGCAMSAAAKDIVFRQF